MNFLTYLAKLETGAALAPEEIDVCFAALMDGLAEHEDIKRFLRLTIPHMRDPALIAGGAMALRARMIRVSAPEAAIDVCGTGGDGAHTLNISTSVAFVLAGLGVPVAKHGNRAMSSKCGAADVLEALGVKLTGDVATLERCLKEAGVAFLFAQNHHPAMRYVGPARKEIGKRTIFNLLGPLSNPAGVKRQLVGVFARDLVEPMLTALKEVGAVSAAVVHGAGGLDEFSVVRGGTNYYTSLDKFGRVESVALPVDQIATMAFELDEIRGGEAPVNAFELRALLGGSSANRAYRAAVVLNASAALGVAGKAESWAEGSEMAEESLRGGAALKALDKLIEISRSAP